ncbi:MAG: type VI secretion system tip protein VgrG [Fibrobacteria bacterium]|nr:type VI secretion system tip protein VgrG [Fibrobacteria bacterium]
MASANTSQIELNISGVSGLVALDFFGSETLSNPFTFTVRALSDKNNILQEKHIGRPATLTLYHNKSPQTYFGFLESFEETPSLENGLQYRCTIVPRLKRLAYNTRCHIFQNKSTSEIVNEVLEKSGLSVSDYKWSLKNPLTSRPFTIQYNETDLNFIQRLLEQEGLFYFFDNSGNSEVVIITDNNESTKRLTEPSALILHPDTGSLKQPGISVYALMRRYQAVTEKVLLKDYNYQTPESNILGRAAGNDSGEFYRFAGNIPTTDEANRQATLMQGSFKAKKVTLTGKSDCTALGSGCSFQLRDSTQSGFEGHYLITSITHSASQESSVTGGGGSDKGYHNNFTCIPLHINYRPPITARKPHVPGVMVAKVDGQQGANTFLDENGRYRVRMPFDLSGLTDGTASCPVRLSQSYAGPNYGTHFPLHTGTDMVIAFENGDIDRPVALGAVPNPSTSSPVTSANQTENLIRTASGHQMLMKDLPNKTQLSLASAGGQFISMNDDKDNKGLLFLSESGHSLSLDDKNDTITFKTAETGIKTTLNKDGLHMSPSRGGNGINIEPGSVSIQRKAGGHELHMDNKKKLLHIKTKEGQILNMDDKNQTFTLQTKSGNMLLLDDKSNKISIQDKAGKNIIQMNIKKNTIAISSDGKLELSAKKAIKMAAPNIVINATKGGINLTATKKTNIKAMALNIKSDQKTQLQSGTDTGIKAGVNLNLEGSVNVNSKAGIANKTTGISVSSEGSGINKVKGAIVMIN